MKKQLLKETEIRKMMKFANIGALSNGFVERLNEQAEMEEPEEVEIQKVNSHSRSLRSRIQTPFINSSDMPGGSPTSAMRTVVALFW